MATQSFTLWSEDSPTLPYLSRERPRSNIDSIEPKHYIWKISLGYTRTTMASTTGSEVARWSQSYQSWSQLQALVQ
ncbi:hypothetical protein M3180_22390 [Paenibacillus camelliae]|nr:hypothetical protein [Paenibacillus camelliae]